MISALNYTDYLYRPRRPEELDTAQGGGAIFNQAAHQVDIVRLIGGGMLTAVRAATGAWDRTRPTEGAYAAMLTFAGGAYASLAYNGFGHFDSDEFNGGRRNFRALLCAISACAVAKRGRPPAYGVFGAPISPIQPSR
jgi:phthalate 4,5-cis-dihydrodiol dehydrogenase